MPNKYTNGTALLAIPERFFHYVEFTDSCWLWTGAARRGGYGCFTLAHGKSIQAHRWAYEFCVGPIPEGLTLDHLCHNKDQSCLGGPTCPHHNCVNPDHLEPVTPRVNTLRGRGRAAQQARQTHCIRGHAFSEENTYHEPSRKRVCRICRKATDARRRLRMRAA